MESIKTSQKLILPAFPNKIGRETSHKFTFSVVFNKTITECDIFTEIKKIQGEENKSPACIDGVYYCMVFGYVADAQMTWNYGKRIGRINLNDLIFDRMFLLISAYIEVYLKKRAFLTWVGLMISNLLLIYFRDRFEITLLLWSEYKQIN